MSTDKQLSEPEQASRTRRAEPITQHIAKNGTVSYWFQADVGTKPDGSRDRRRFTYRTKAEAPRVSAHHQRGSCGHLHAADGHHR